MQVPPPGEDQADRLNERTQYECSLLSIRWPRLRRPAAISAPNRAFAYLFEAACVSRRCLRSVGASVVGVVRRGLGGVTARNSASGLRCFCCYKWALRAVAERLARLPLPRSFRARGGRVRRELEAARGGRAAGRAEGGGARVGARSCRGWHTRPAARTIARSVLGARPGVPLDGAVEPRLRQGFRAPLLPPRCQGCQGSAAKVAKARAKADRLTAQATPRRTRVAPHGGRQGRPRPFPRVGGGLKLLVCSVSIKRRVGGRCRSLTFRLLSRRVGA